MSKPIIIDDNHPWVRDISDFIGGCPMDNKINIDNVMIVKPSEFRKDMTSIINFINEEDTVVVISSTRINGDVVVMSQDKYQQFKQFETKLKGE